MANGAENNLTENGSSSMIVSDNEKRILTNLRVQAERNPHAQLAVLFQVHDGKLHYGTLCLGVAPNTSTIRL